MNPLHIVFTDLPDPDDRCQFVEVETPKGESISVGEWRKRDDGYVEIVVPSPDLKAEIAAEIYKALEKLGAPPELFGTVGSYGDTLTDEDRCPA